MSIHECSIDEVLLKKRRIRPRRLRVGQTIGIVAPSGSFDLNLFEQGIKIIERSGFSAKFDNRIFAAHKYFAGSDSERAAVLNEMISDEQVHAIMCARGGYGALRILSKVDYDNITNSAKPFIGFSDITALHRAIWLKCGLVTFHGPVVTTLARCDKTSLSCWYRTLTEPITPTIDLSNTRILKPGKAVGIITGGNLTTLCHLTGTLFGSGYNANLLLIEDVGEAPYRVDRMLTHMKMAGLFEGVSAVLIGSFETCGEPQFIDRLILEIFENMQIPIISGFPAGHREPNWTLPMGVCAHLDTEKKELVFIEPTFNG